MGHLHWNGKSRWGGWKKEINKWNRGRRKLEDLTSTRLRPSLITFNWPFPPTKRIRAIIDFSLDPLKIGQTYEYSLHWPQRFKDLSRRIDFSSQYYQQEFWKFEFRSESGSINATTFIWLTWDLQFSVYSLNSVVSSQKYTCNYLLSFFKIC